MARPASIFAFILIAVIGATAYDTRGWTAPDLDRRSINAAGGWPANAFYGTNSTECSAGNTFCFGGNCCPSELSCVGTEDPVNCVCCPAGVSCETTFQQNPVCANSEWTLWNATSQGEHGGFFCCEEGQIGDNIGGCWPPGTVLAASNQAVQLAPGRHTTVNVTSTSTSKVKLSHKAIIGIAIGAGVVVILLLLVLGCCCWKCWCKGSRKGRQEVYNPSYEPYRPR
ncbi:hypothetical protein L207DRAFT_575815 [Hyaloscypha variabilis F]|uniref:Mid2 domain-containing protein n=1 Tax=Hyaloscypha variabilis (strain UAMH 11265 / GT02V1 / F) TaxID=1149755 RepID=A0A2J6S8D6_HYAVF|nr:hypothetical protein L207DRAFT_575815 [Hyaloscypha variabilis F]